MSCSMLVITFNTMLPGMYAFTHSLANIVLDYNPLQGEKVEQQLTFNKMFFFFESCRSVAVQCSLENEVKAVLNSLAV